MKKAFYNYLLVVTVLSALLLSCGKEEVYNDTDAMVAAAKEKTTPITPDDLKVKIDSAEYFTLIDVREPYEFNAGYIPGSVNIPRGTLEFSIGKESFWDEQFMYMPEKSELIIVYCKKGTRSILAAESLQKLGYENILYLDGGWKNWELTYPLIYEKNLDLQPAHHASEGGC